MSCLHCLVILLAVISLSESVYIQPTRSCSQLGKYTFKKNLRDRLATGVLFYQGKKHLSTSRLYLCALEGLAGLILENPNKPLNRTFDLDIFPLPFESDGKISDANYVAREAIQVYAAHMPSLSVATGFGCNAVVENRKHKYLCLFKLNTKIRT